MNEWSVAQSKMYNERDRSEAFEILAALLAADEVGFGLSAREQLIGPEQHRLGWRELKLIGDEFGRGLDERERLGR